MELKEFVAESIKQIADALIESNEYIKSKNGEGIERGYKRVEFDVAVTVNEEEKSDIGGKISVVKVFSLGSKVEDSNSITSYSRIKFETFISV